MRYEFPRITHINDVLPAIAERDEFIVVQKDGYQVVNYAVMMEDSFPVVDSVHAALRRECRGLVFDLEGLVLLSEITYVRLKSAHPTFERLIL